MYIDLSKCGLKNEIKLLKKKRTIFFSKIDPCTMPGEPRPRRLGMETGSGGRWTSLLVVTRYKFLSKKKRGI